MFASIINTSLTSASSPSSSQLPQHIDEVPLSTAGGMREDQRGVEMFRWLCAEYANEVSIIQVCFVCMYEHLEVDYLLEGNVRRPPSHAYVMHFVSNAQPIKNNAV